MTSIDSILRAVAPDAGAPDARVIEADLARGRAALASARRRRRARGMSLVAGAAAVTGVTVAIASTSDSHRGARRAALAPTSPGVLKLAPPHAGSHAGRRVRTAAPRVQLVAYTGAQLPGFTVKRVPTGWHLSTSTSTALLITRDGSTNNDPDDFLGKLAVLPQSIDEQGLGPGVPVTVDGRPGRFDDQYGGPILRYTTADGHAVDIQAPSALHWSAGRLVAFAEGVAVTADVGVARG